MSWREVARAVKEIDIIIVPVAATENMGPHLPLGCDSILVQALVKEISKRVEVFIAPTIPFGYSKVHQKFPGTITLRPEVFGDLVEDVCMSLIPHGFKKIIFFNAHVGNLPILKQVSEKLRLKTGTLFAILHVWKLVSQVEPGVAKLNGHGGDLITSVILALAPNLVDMNEAIDTKPKQISESITTKYPFTFKYGPGEVLIPLFVDEISELGIWGNPTTATKEKGNKLLKTTVDYLINFIEEFKKLET